MYGLKGRKYVCSDGCHVASGLFAGNLPEYRPFAEGVPLPSEKTALPQPTDGLLCEVSTTRFGPGGADFESERPVGSGTSPSPASGLCEAPAQTAVQDKEQRRVSFNLRESDGEGKGHAQERCPATGAGAGGGERSAVGLGAVLARDERAPPSTQFEPESFGTVQIPAADS